MNLGNILARKGKNVVTIDMSWSLQAAAALMMRHHVAALVVTDCGRPVGLVSERDLVGALADTGSRVARIPLREMVAGPVPAVSADQSIMHAISLMTEKHLRFLPVFDSGKLIGMVTLPDLIKYRLQEIELAAVSSATWPLARGRIEEVALVSDEPLLIPHNSDLGPVPATLVA